MHARKDVLEGRIWNSEEEAPAHHLLSGIRHPLAGHHCIYTLYL
jgi:hypothetical protein